MTLCSYLAVILASRGGAELGMDFAETADAGMVAAQTSRQVTHGLMRGAAIGKAAIYQ